MTIVGVPASWWGGGAGCLGESCPHPITTQAYGHHDDMTDVSLASMKARAWCVLQRGRFPRHFLHLRIHPIQASAAAAGEEEAIMRIELPTKELLQNALSASANSVAKLVFLTLLGVWATANGVFNDQGVSDLGRLVYHVTLPALLFVNIISEVTVARLLVLWKLPAMALLHISSGYLLARLLNKVFRIRGIGQKAVTLCLMFGNVGSLSIAIIDTLCTEEPLASEVGPSCALKGVEYISFYLITSNILMFSWAEEIVKDHSDDHDVDSLVDGLGEYVDDEEEEEAEDSPAYATPVTIPGAVGVPTDDPQLPPPLPVRPSSLSTSRRKGSFVRFHEGGIEATSMDAAEAGERPASRGRSQDGVLVPAPPSSDGSGGGTPRLKRFYSQPQMLDQEDINSILSRYPVESRPRLDTDGGLVSSLSSSYMPSLALSPALHRRRGSRVDLPAQTELPAQERDRLLGGQRRRTGSLGMGPPSGNSSTYQATGLPLPPPPIQTQNLQKAPPSSPPALVYVASPRYLPGPPPTCHSRLLDCWDGSVQVMGRMAANPSIRAAMVAFVLGLIPPIKALFVPSDGRPDPPLGAFLGAIQILGQAQVPCSMLMLSGSGTIRYLNDKAAKNEVATSFSFSPKTIFSIILGRVLLFPLVGLMWWWAGFEAGFFADTPVLSLVLLLDAAVPTAQNVVMLVLVHGHAEHGHALAYVILWQYALCIPVLILNLTLYLAIIRSAYPL